MSIVDVLPAPVQNLAGLFLTTKKPPGKWKLLWRRSEIGSGTLSVKPTGASAGGQQENSGTGTHVSFSDDERPKKKNINNQKNQKKKNKLWTYEGGAARGSANISTVAIICHPGLLLLKRAWTPRGDTRTGEHVECKEQASQRGLKASKWPES